MRDAKSNEWEGREVRGLVDSRHRPDGVIRDAQGVVARVCFFNGNYWHGWPPGHELDHSTLMRMNQRPDRKDNAALYKQIRANMRLFKNKGLQVDHVWEHEFSAHTREKRPDSMLEQILHRL